MLNEVKRASAQLDESNMTVYIFLMPRIEAIIVNEFA